jgi:two-component system phosphate regulon sensor histidine kinase PhoR
LSGPAAAVARLAFHASVTTHIVNRHRGRLQIESTLGQGAAFTVRLPLGPAAHSCDNTAR